MKSKGQTWLFLLIIFFQAHLYFAADTISSGESLTQYQSLVSKSGIFQLGFFTPGNSLKYYVGIWYKNIPTQSVVWVANRDTPLTDPFSSELKLLDNGNLVLFNSSSKIAIWSTNTTSKAINSSEVVLGDEGNLVLRNRVRPSDVFWQSFDYPTHTWLPGAKLRYDSITRNAVSLSSWKNENDPGTGLYSLELDPIRDQYVILRNRTQRYWTSGQWNGRSFNGVPEMRMNYIYNFSYTKNENESYFTYSLYNTSIVSRFVMEVTGQISQYSWDPDTKNWFLFWSQPRQQCAVYNFCGAFGKCNQNLPICTCLDGFKPRTPNKWNFTDYSGGCVKNTSLQCGNKDDFSPIQNVKLPQQPLAVPSASSADECKSACLNNCSCSAYAYSRVGCSVWNGDLLSLQEAPDGDGSGIDLYLRQLAASVNNFPMGKKPLKVYIIVLIAGSSFISILACVFLAYKMTQRGKTKYEGREISLLDLSKTHEIERGKLELPSFDFNTVSAATNNFSNKLGQGGFGSVYKGKLLDEREIAVKRLSRSSGQGVQEFKNELVLISKLQHRNLVRLLGFCIDKEEMMLLYEYMPNKSLDTYLFDPAKRVLLDWSKRFNIVDGIARGLLYLHRDSRFRVIHRDLKASNILLDEDMNPKISDFGMARIFGGKQRLANTNRVVGTYGYMSPEYAMEGIFSEKSDVFSFGVLLLEIVSSKKNNSFCLPEESYNNLLGFVWRLWNENKALELMDPTLVESYNSQELMRFIHMGLLCVQDHALDRPTMSTIVSMLCSDATLPIPKQPTFTLQRSPNINDAGSINSITVTIPQGR